MLPNLRFAIGAVLASLVLILTAFGLAATVRIAHQAKMGPFEATRTLAYADPADWNQFYDADGTRRFDGMGRKADSTVIDALIEHASISAPPVASPSAKPADDREELIVAIAPVGTSAGDKGSVAADPEMRAELTPLLEPKPEIETIAPTATAPTATIKTAVVVESAPSTKDVERAIAEPVPAVAPSEQVASLPSPADTEAAGPGDSKSQAAALGPQVQKATPAAKRATKAKKKVAKRKTSPRSPTVDTGFPGITTRNGQDNWLFNRN